MKKNRPIRLMPATEEKATFRAFILQYARDHKKDDEWIQRQLTAGESDRAFVFLDENPAGT